MEVRKLSLRSIEENLAQSPDIRWSLLLVVLDVSCSRLFFPVSSETTSGVVTLLRSHSRFLLGSFQICFGVEMLAGLLGFIPSLARASPVNMVCFP